MTSCAKKEQKSRDNLLCQTQRLLRKVRSPTRFASTHTVTLVFCRFEASLADDKFVPISRGDELESAPLDEPSNEADNEDEEHGTETGTIYPLLQTVLQATVPCGLETRRSL